MRAYRLDDFTSLDDLHLHEEVESQPQRGEVLVRVHAASLNFRDIAMLRNQYPAPHLKGLIPTSDGAGEVIAVGSGVDDFKVGDRVMGTFQPRWYAGRMPTNLGQYHYGSAVDGWLTEQKVTSQEALVRIPDHLTYEEASTLPCAGLTAWTALSEGAAIRSGDTVLVLGTGGVSIFALQLAKALGARVIATTSTEQKAERLRALGADEVINYTEDPQWGERVRALSHGGVDRIVEVGGPGTMSQSLRAIRPGGEIALIGFVSPEGGGIDFINMFMSGSTLRHIAVGNREGLQALGRAVEMAGIKPVIDRVFDFDDAKAAFAHLISASHIGKVVVRCAEAWA
ncbi:zinc-dependent alcohol dehydrogenase family protein [Pseudomonas syringae group genomosp. 3]|uniref:zinc-dependent alcohol dehydrogenase family protein n=1 Tax=Pseudomonas syringae group genomosp. 3 TaxID=251701 RepID=UPI0005C81691|nr:NAD(P)-dependent alcohol dehydrogenase [Pseudomonas syringae group genomosp. 3]